MYTNATHPPNIMNYADDCLICSRERKAALRSFGADCGSRSLLLGDRAENSNLYASGFVGSSVIPDVAKRGARTALRRGQRRVKPNAWRVGVTLFFDGGVTAEWVGRRLAYAMKLVATTTSNTRGRGLRTRSSRSATTAEPQLYRSLFSSIGL